MQFTSTRDERAITFVLNGQLTNNTLKTDQDELAQFAGEEIYKRTVILNLEGVDYIDSAALGWILSRNKKCREAGGKLILYGVVPQVLSIFRVLKLEKVLHIAENASQLQLLLA